VLLHVSIIALISEIFLKSGSSVVSNKSRKLGFIP